MKRKNLFYVMAASLAFTACADEEFATKTQPIDNGMVDVEDIDMVFTKETGDTESRALWTENANKSLSFNWEKGDKIGLVYVGQGGKVGLTNYEFESDSLQLPSYKAKSGQTRWTGFFQVDETLAQVQTAYTDKDGVALTALPTSSTSAKFATQYDAIMKGYYVTYHPYNTDYKNAGEAIPVTAPKRYTTATDKGTALANVAKYTFSYSSPAEVKAGKQSTQFNLKNLSSVLRVRIANEAEATQPMNIKSVVLRTKGNDAFVVKGTLVDPSAAASASNITIAADGKSSTLFVDYPSTDYLTLAAGKAKPATENAQGDTLDVYFPVLPVTFAESGVEVIVIKSDNMACVVNANFKAAGQTLPAGRAVNLYTTITKDTKFDQSFVTSAADLQTTINNCKTAASTTTINLLGDIESTSLNMHDVAVTAWNKGVIINASVGSKLTLKNPNIALYNKDVNNAQDNTVFSTLTINAPLTIEGGKLEGTIIVDDVTFKGNVQVGHATSLTDNYFGQLTIKGDATIEKNAVLTSAFAFNTGITIAEGATLTIKEGGKFVNDNFCFNVATRNYYKSDLFINGTMTVDAKATFEDKGDTHISSTGKLVVNGTLNNWNQVNVAGGTIEVAGVLNNNAAATGFESANYTGAGNIKMSTGKLTLATAGKIFNRASLNCMGTFENNGTFNDYVGSVYGGNPFTSNGVYACYVNSQQRLLEAVTRLNIYAAGKYQKIVLQTGATYELDKINPEKALALNIENEGNVQLLNSIAEDSRYYETIQINSLHVVGDGATVTLPDNIDFVGAAIGETTVAPITIDEKAKLTINNNITVKANGEIVNAGTFDLLPAASSADIPATVYCTKADVTKGVWTNYPIVTASSNFWE